MSIIRALTLIASAAAIMACADASTSPDAAIEANGTTGKSGVTGDTTQNVPTTPFRVSGRVFAVTTTTATQGSDTLQYFSSPIAGIPLRIMRNVLVNGSSGQVLAANTTSDANGNWEVNGLAGGYYVVYAEPAATSVYGGSHAYIAGTSASVKVDVYIWRKQ